MTSTQRERRSPVTLSGRPVKTESRNDWIVVLEYAQEGAGPWLVDLSHTTRLDVQGKDLQGLLPPAFPVPEAPGGVHAGQEMLIARMNAVQACFWLFDAKVEIPRRYEITEITEASAGLALLGGGIVRLAEKLTSLDLLDSRRQAPFLIQGPFSHVPCQLIVLGNEAGKEALLLTCSRGYAHDMVHAIGEAGEEYGLRAAGEERFLQLLRAITERHQV